MASLAAGIAQAGYPKTELAADRCGSTDAGIGCPTREFTKVSALSWRAGLERVTGIEPAWPAWKAGALPLSYTRVVPGKDSQPFRHPVEW